MANVIKSSAPEAHIIVEQGATFDVLMTWEDERGDLIDLTGYTGCLQVRSTSASSTVLLDLTTENGGLVLGGAAGTIRVYMSMAQTAALNFDTGRYQFELYPPAAGTAKRLLKGRFTVDKEIVR